MTLYLALTCAVLSLVMIIGPTLIHALNALLTVSATLGGS